MPLAGIACAGTETGVTVVAYASGQFAVLRLDKADAVSVTFRWLRHMDRQCDEAVVDGSQRMRSREVSPPVCGEIECL